MRHDTFVSFANIVFWCSRCKIHRYVSAPIQGILIIVLKEYGLSVSKEKSNNYYYQCKVKTNQASLGTVDASLYTVFQLKTRTSWQVWEWVIDYYNISVVVA